MDQILVRIDDNDDDNEKDGGYGEGEMCRLNSSDY